MENQFFQQLSRPLSAARALAAAVLVVVPLVHQDARAFEREMYQVDGVGVVQDFAFDHTGNWLFVHSIEKVGAEEVSRVSRVELTKNVAAKVKDTSGPIPELGHQGLSVENRTNGPIWLWGSAAEEKGRTAVRFKYEKDGTPPKVEVYTLFDEKFMAKNVTMPKVCIGGDKLIVRGRIKSREQVIRVFDLETLKSGGPGDYSTKFTAEWPIPKDMLEDGTPLQGIACDYERVYVIGGHAVMDEPKRVFVLSMTGQVIRKDDRYSRGRDAARSDGKFFEPEGLSVRTDSTNGKHSPWVGVLSGQGNRKVFRIWEAPELN